MEIETKIAEHIWAMAESINLKSFQMYKRLFLDQVNESWYYHEDSS